MKKLTKEWVTKAEAAFVVANELRQVPAPVHDARCFHCQQAAEKYLKAILVELGVSVPKTHNLVDVLALSIAASLSQLASTSAGAYFPDGLRGGDTLSRRECHKTPSGSFVTLGHSSPGGGSAVAWPRDEPATAEEIDSLCRLTIHGRTCTMDVMEVPDDAPVLIGQMPPEYLDLVVDVVRTHRDLILHPQQREDLAE